MNSQEAQVSKSEFAYVNFFSNPDFLEKETKLQKYKGAFDFLFILKEHFQITVFDFIGINTSFKKKDVTFNYFKKKTNSKLIIPWTLFMKLRNMNPNIVYIQGLGYPHFIVLLKLFLASNTKIIVHDHANAIPKGSKQIIFKWADKYIYKYLFTSKQLAEPWLKSGLISLEDKIVECVEGSTQFKYKPEIIKEKNSFLWVGRLDNNKDPITILKAFKEFLSHTNATLTMFYKETELLPQVENFIQTNSLENKVTLKGAVRNKELEIWYQKSEFFILGSYKEGGPFSLIEAMACGCIPIVSNIPAHKTMTNYGKCGYLFNSGNSKKLLFVLENLKEEERIEKRKETLLFFKNNLSHEAIASKITNASI